MIWKYETKKVLKNPVIWGLFCFFLFINGFLIWTNLDGIWGEICDVSVLLQEEGSDALNETYLQELKKQYDSLDMMEIKETKENLYNYQATGIFEKFIDSNYTKLQERVEEIKANGEVDDVTYPGEAYRLHTKLYAKIFRAILLEMGIFVVLCILYLMDYERLQKTSSLVYSTHTGRKIQVFKWSAGLLSGLGIGCGLMAITLAAWFLSVPYKGFWNCSVSAALAMEPREMLAYPFITYEKMTILEYLIASILFGLLLLIVLGILTGVVQFLLKNSYFAVLAIVILLLGDLYLTTISFGSVWDLVVSWNLAYLWSSSGAWFMENNLIDSFQGAQVVNAGIQLVVFGGLWSLLYKRFQKKDC